MSEIGLAYGPPLSPREVAALEGGRSDARKPGELRKSGPLRLRKRVARIELLLEDAKRDLEEAIVRARDQNRWRIYLLTSRAMADPNRRFSFAAMGRRLRMPGHVVQQVWREIYTRRVSARHNDTARYFAKEWGVVPSGLATAAMDWVPEPGEEWQTEAERKMGEFVGRLAAKHVAESAPH